MWLTGRLGRTSRPSPTSGTTTARGVPADKIAVMGFSKGGSAVMYAADRTMVATELDRFVVAIAFYPGCVSHPVQPRPASIVFMALAEKDDWVGVTPCQQLASEYKEAGGQITVKVYPDAGHGFDGDTSRLNMTRVFVDNYKDCIIRIEPDGTQVFGDKRFVYGDPAITFELNRTCARKGATTWTNPKQKEIATQDVLSFLDVSLRTR
jgi:dienelactone hydrolase